MNQDDTSSTGADTPAPTDQQGDAQAPVDAAPAAEPTSAAAPATDTPAPAAPTPPQVVNINCFCNFKGHIFPGVTVWPGANAKFRDAVCDPGLIDHIFTREDVLDDAGNQTYDSAGMVITAMVNDDNAEVHRAARQIITFPNTNVDCDNFALYYDQVSGITIGTAPANAFLQIRPA